MLRTASFAGSGRAALDALVPWLLVEGVPVSSCPRLADRPALPSISVAIVGPDEPLHGGSLYASHLQPGTPTGANEDVAAFGSGSSGGGGGSSLSAGSSSGSLNGDAPGDGAAAAAAQTSDATPAARAAAEGGQVSVRIPGPAAGEAVPGPPPAVQYQAEVAPGPVRSPHVLPFWRRWGWGARSQTPPNPFIVSGTPLGLPVCTKEANLAWLKATQVPGGRRTVNWPLHRCLVALLLVLLPCGACLLVAMAGAHTGWAKLTATYTQQPGASLPPLAPTELTAGWLLMRACLADGSCGASEHLWDLGAAAGLVGKVSFATALLSLLWVLLAAWLAGKALRGSWRPTTVHRVIRFMLFGFIPVGLIDLCLGCVLYQTHVVGLLQQTFPHEATTETHIGPLGLAHLGASLILLLLPPPGLYAMLWATGRQQPREVVVPGWPSWELAFQAQAQYQREQRLLFRLCSSLKNAVGWLNCAQLRHRQQEGGPAAPAPAEQGPAP